MTEQGMQDLVKECGLDWHRGYMPLFEGDPTNRYAVLIREVISREREACAKLCGLIASAACARRIRARGNKTGEANEPF